MATVVFPLPDAGAAITTRGICGMRVSLFLPDRPADRPGYVQSAESRTHLGATSDRTSAKKAGHSVLQGTRSVMDIHLSWMDRSDACRLWHLVAAASPA
ncbi:hypothetical protein GCM10009800_18870 [Nocardiopsis rhodophaea]